MVSLDFSSHSLKQQSASQAMVEVIFEPDERSYVFGTRDSQHGVF